jgi:hypothetical protein
VTGAADENAASPDRDGRQWDRQASQKTGFGTHPVSPLKFRANRWRKNPKSVQLLHKSVHTGSEGLRSLEK